MLRAAALALAVWFAACAAVDDTSNLPPRQQPPPRTAPVLKVPL